MENSLHLLMDIIGKQKQIYDELYILAKKKNNAIERGDVSELDYVVEAEELLLIHLSKIENQRISLIETTAKSADINPSELTIKTWPNISNDEVDDITNLQNEFVSTLEKIEQINETNQKLISIQLDYIKHVFDVTNGSKKHNSYDNSGKIDKDDENGSRIVDIRM